MASLTYVDQTATFEPKGDNMVMTITSNGLAQCFIMPRGTFTASLGAGHRAARDWFSEQQEAAVIPFTARKRSARA